MKSLYKGYIFIICCFLYLTSQSQSYTPGTTFRFDNIGVKDGLPTPAVVDIFRDDRGFVWFYSTRDLVRYDGFSFKKYPFSNQLYELIHFGAGTAGRFFVTDGLTLFRFDPDRDYFKPIPLPQLSEQLDAISFIPTFKTQARNYFRHGNRIYTLLPFDDKPHLYAEHVLPSDRYLGVVPENGAPWLSQSLIRTQSSQLQQFLPDGDIRLTDTIPAFSHDIFDDDEGNLWLGTWTKGLWQYKLSAGTSKQFLSSSQENHFFDIATLPAWTGMDILWCNSRNEGLYLFDKTSERFVQNIRADEVKPQSLGSSSVYMYHYDRENILWTGTHVGVSMMHPRKQRVVQQYLHSPKDEYLTLPVVSLKPLPLESCFFLFKETDIKIYDPNEHVWRTIDKNKYGLSEEKIGKFFKACIDADGRFWLATPTGLYLVDRSTGRPFRKLPGLSGKQFPFGAIYPDTAGNIWWFDRYLRRYNTRSGATETYLDSRDSTQLMPNEGLISIRATQDGRLWLAGLKSIVRFNPATRSVERFRLTIPPNSERYDPHVNRMVTESDSVIWISTTYGLVRLDVRTQKQHILYPQVDSTTAYGGGGLALDRFGNVWTGDHYGIYRLDRKTGQFSAIDVRDGCSSNVLYDLVVNGDRIIANRYLGVVDKIDPDLFQNKQPALPVYITDLFFGEERLSVPLDSTAGRPFQFRARDRTISIHYTAIDFDQPHKARFEYKLEPFDREWVHAGSNRIATYTNLEGGNYIFRVRVVNGDGIISEVQAPLYFYVPLVWYRTWWFYIGCLFALGALFYLFFRYREIRRLEQEKLRLRIARDLHDEMGSTLSSISILSEAALRHLQADIDRARFGVIGDRTRQVMDAMSDIVWSVNPRNDTMENVLQRMKEFAVEILEAQNITVHFSVDNTAQKLNLPMEKRKDFYLIFKEAINNAAKYSQATDVWVQVYTENGQLILEVRDNGKGFDPAQIKRGNGLWNMERRAERMGGQLMLSSSMGKGVNLRLEYIP